MAVVRQGFSLCQPGQSTDPAQQGIIMPLVQPHGGGHMPILLRWVLAGMHLSSCYLVTSQFLTWWYEQKECSANDSSWELQEPACICAAWHAAVTMAMCAHVCRSDHTLHTAAEHACASILGPTNVFCHNFYLFSDLMIHYICNCFPPLCQCCTTSLLMTWVTAGMEVAMEVFATLQMAFLLTHFRQHIAGVGSPGDQNYFLSRNACTVVCSQHGTFSL